MVKQGWLNKGGGRQLVHVNGVTDAIVSRDYFATIVEFSELLSPNDE